jgi:hypothetical protein
MSKVILAGCFVSLMLTGCFPSKTNITNNAGRIVTRQLVRFVSPQIVDRVRDIELGSADNNRAE